MKLEDLIKRTSKFSEDKIVSTYGNGFELTTETFLSSNPNRVLPIGGPQDAILNYMAHHRELVEGKNVFEPYAGSGVFGLMSLKMGAKSADLLDINEHAIEIQLENAQRNNLKSERLRCLMGDINHFVSEKKYDLILANPPFLPTPHILEGTIHSNGGVDGNELCIPLIKNLANWLAPEGEALIYMAQIMVGSTPSITKILLDEVHSREIEITIIQNKSASIETVFNAYRELFSLDSGSIEKWRKELGKLGQDLGFNNCIIHIKPEHDDETQIFNSFNIDEKYGFGSLDQYMPEEVTTARIRENVL